jgi:hypothetical protein
MTIAMGFISEASWTGMTAIPALALKSNVSMKAAPVGTFERLAMEVPITHMIPKMFKSHPLIVSIGCRAKSPHSTSYATVTNETPSASNFTLRLDKWICDKIGRDLLVWMVLDELSDDVGCRPL